MASPPLCWCGVGAPVGAYPQSQERRPRGLTCPHPLSAPTAQRAAAYSVFQTWDTSRSARQPVGPPFPGPPDHDLLALLGRGEPCPTIPSPQHTYEGRMGPARQLSPAQGALSWSATGSRCERPASLTPQTGRASARGDGWPAGSAPGEETPGALRMRDQASLKNGQYLQKGGTGMARGPACGLGGTQETELA